MVEKTGDPAQHTVTPETCECPARKALEGIVFALHDDERLDMDEAIAALAVPCTEWLYRWTCGHIRRASDPAGPCPICAERDQLRADMEEARQTLARLTAPGVERAPWFYAPCPECGVIEGMGLVTTRVNGVLIPDHTSVWCAHCEHFGPGVPRQAETRNTDRAATMAWNAEFREAWAERDQLRADLAESRREDFMARVYRNASRCVEMLEVAGMGGPGKPNCLVDMVPEMIAERDQLRADLAEALDALGVFDRAVEAWMDEGGELADYLKGSDLDRAVAVISKHAARTRAVRTAHATEPDPQLVRPQKKDIL